MNQTDRTQLFETTPIPRALAVLTVPTVMSSLVMVMYSLADTYFVGMLNDPVQSSAVTLAAPVLLAFNAINNLFGVGSASMMSRAMGRKDFETVSRSSAFGFWCAAAGGLLISLACILCRGPLLLLLGADAQTYAATEAYMRWTVCCGAAPSILNVVMAHMVRAEGNALHASVGTMSGCLLNIALDPLFILPQGLGLGAAGAGFATMISNCVACSYFFILLFLRRRDTRISLHPKHFTLRKDVVRGVLGVGLPASIQNLLNVTGMTVLNNFAAAYGATALAAAGITHKIGIVAMQISMGFSQGVMPLVGYNYASGNIRRMREAVQLAVKIALSFVAAVAVCYILFAGSLVRLFINNDEIVAYGTRFMRGVALGLPFLCMDFLAVGVFQAVGMGRYSLVFAILRKIVLEIPALYALNALFPLYGLAYAQPAAELILSIAAVVMLMRLFRRLAPARAGTNGAAPSAD